MKRPLVLIALLAALPVTALAHKAWLLPSQTVLAGEAPWITVDAAVSNDLFYFNHVPLRLDNLSITAPDGSALKPENPATGKYRSVFDLQLTQPGTYKLSITNAGLFASWKEDGKPKRWRGNETSFATEVPKNAQELQVSQSLNRVETFVTRGAPTTTVFKPSGKGIELIPVTHPNDLVAGEAAQFTLQLDGKPAAGLEIEIVRGGTATAMPRTRSSSRPTPRAVSSVTWPEPGMYWLETTTEDTKTSLPQAKQRRLGYVATLEVLPQ